MTKRWQRERYGDRYGEAHPIQPRRKLSDDETVHAYTSTLTHAEAAAFLAGLGWGLGHGPTWIADTVRRLLPGRLAEFERERAAKAGRP
jgi:hypothetical protein